MTKNTQIRLLSRPTGRAAVENFERFEAETPEPKPGEALVRMRWLAIDVGMANRLRDEKTMLPVLKLGSRCMVQVLAKWWGAVIQN